LSSTQRPLTLTRQKIMMENVPFCVYFTHVFLSLPTSFPALTPSFELLSVVTFPLLAALD
jgi:hypothetical protein